MSKPLTYTIGELLGIKAKPVPCGKAKMCPVCENFLTTTTVPDITSKSFGQFDSIECCEFCADKILKEYEDES